MRMIANHLIDQGTYGQALAQLLEHARDNKGFTPAEVHVRRKVMARLNKAGDGELIVLEDEEYYTLVEVLNEGGFLKVSPALDDMLQHVLSAPECEIVDGRVERLDGVGDLDWTGTDGG